MIQMQRTFITLLPLPVHHPRKYQNISSQLFWTNSCALFRNLCFIQRVHLVLLLFLFYMYCCFVYIVCSLVECFIINKLIFNDYNK